LTRRPLARVLAPPVIALALWSTVAAAQTAPLPAADAGAIEKPPWRISLEGGLAFGGMGGLPVSSGRGGVVGVFGRLYFRLSDRISLAGAGALFGVFTTPPDTVAEVRRLTDLGLELRGRRPFNVRRTNFETGDLYLSVPFGISSVHLNQVPHRAFVERLETHRQPYLGVAGGMALAGKHLGLFGELRYCYHPLRFTDTITPLDGSQPPLVENVDSAGHQITLLVGLSLGK
jgi:hypothetical protein